MNARDNSTTDFRLRYYKLITIYKLAASLKDDPDKLATFVEKNKTFFPSVDAKSLKTSKTPKQ